MPTDQASPCKPARRRYQFSLKTLMLLVAVTAATLGLLVAGGTFALTLVLPMAGAIYGCALRKASGQRRIRAAVLGGALGVLVGIGVHYCFHPILLVHLFYVVVYLIHGNAWLLLPEIVPAFLAAITGIVLGFAFGAGNMVADGDQRQSSVTAAQANTHDSKRKARRWLLGLGRLLLAVAVLAILYKVVPWWPGASRVFIVRHAPRPASHVRMVVYSEFIVMGPEMVPTLVQALGDDDHGVRALAATALKFNCPQGPQAKEAVPALIKTLNDPRSSTRQRAAIVLGQIGPAAKDAVPALIDALKDPNRHGMHYLVVKALGGIGPAAREAVPALLELRKLRSYDDHFVQRVDATLTEIDPS